MTKPAPVLPILIPAVTSDPPASDTLFPASTLAPSVAAPQAGVLCVSQEVGFLHRPVLERVLPSADDPGSAEDSLQLFDFKLSSRPMPPLSIDDVRVGLQSPVGSDRRVSSSVRQPFLPVSRAEVTKDLKEFGTYLSTLFDEPRPRKRGRPPKSLYLQRSEPSVQSTHIMVTRRSSKSSSSLNLLND